MYRCKSIYDDKVARGKNVKNVYDIVSFSFLNIFAKIILIQHLRNVDLQYKIIILVYNWSSKQIFMYR